MKNEIAETLVKQINDEPFAKSFGLRVLEVKEGYSKVQMKPSPDMFNMFGMIHGGAIFALMDAAFEAACNSHGTVALALNVTITYVSSPSPECLLIAEAKEFSKTRRTANYHITVSDNENNLIASSQALAYRKGTPLPFAK